MALSFSAAAKEELCRDIPHKHCCALAECFGILLFCNSFTSESIKIITESREFAWMLPKLFKRAFDIHFDSYPSMEAPGKLVFQIFDPEKIDIIMDSFGFDMDGTLSLHVNWPVVEEECCRTAFLRGAFLAGGSVTDPAKGYHLELTTNHLHVHRELQALIPELGLQARSTTRKSNYITYFKRSSSISAFLTAIGAPESARAIAQARASKSLLNSVNRQYNCDVANVDKAVAAAQAQIDAIRQLEQRGTLSGLSDSLRETARLRRDNPELSLAQLAAMMNPPVSKSCLNHRLRRLLELAGERSAVQ